MSAGTATGKRTAATAGLQRPPSGTVSRRLVGAVRQLEADERLERAGAAMDGLARRLVCSPLVENGLRGGWAGHALHPLLTDFRLGAWMAASFLDVFGGDPTRGAARRLVGFGLLAAIPTAAAGVAEWHATAGSARRLGVAHAGVNGTATLLYASSWVARRSGAHRSGAALGIGGGLVAFVGGYLGGHLSLVRKIGTAHPDFGSESAASGDVMLPTDTAPARRSPHRSRQREARFDSAGRHQPRRLRRWEEAMFLRGRSSEDRLVSRVVGRGSKKGGTPLSRAGDVIQRPPSWAALAGLISLTGPRGRRAALRGSACYLAAAAVHLPIKAVVGRRHPPGAALHQLGPFTSSFPSGHAAADLGFVFGASQELPKLFLPLSACTMAVHWSLVRKRAHYPSDVLAGGALGIVVAAAAWKLWPPGTSQGGPITNRSSSSDDSAETATHDGPLPLFGTSGQR